MNTPEPVNLGRYREVLSGHPEDVLAHLRERAVQSLGSASAANDIVLLRDAILRLVRVEGDET